MKMNVEDKKKKLKLTLIYIFMAITCSYILAKIKTRDFYIDVTPYDLFYIVIAVICFLIIPKVFQAYKWVFFQFLKKFKIKENILINPLLIYTGLLTLITLLYFISLNYFSIKKYNLPLMDLEQHKYITTLAERTLSQFGNIILYVIIIGIIIVLLYQLYKLHKSKVSFLRSLLATIVSMALLLWLLDVLVFVLDVFTGFF